MKTRYKCITVINGTPVIFKRYGDSVNEVRSDLEKFIKNAFVDSTFQIQTIEVDETHPVEVKK
jgi:hypothetical protein